MYDKEQRKGYNKKYHQDHKEESKIYRQNNPEKIKRYNKKYREKYKEKKRKDDKKYREKNKKEIKEYRERTKEKTSKYNVKYYQNNKEKRKKYDQQPKNKERKNLNQRKRRKNLSYKLSRNISKGVYNSLKSNNLSKNKIHYENLIINTFQEIKEHLEKNFLPGMNWKNYGRNGWVIDHIIPVIFFKFTSTDDVEFKYMWSLENLQPMWKKDNLKKSDKIILWGKEINARNLKIGIQEERFELSYS